MYKLDSTELYKRRIVAMIDRGWIIKDLANAISEPYSIVQQVVFGSKKSLRVEQLIAKELCKEHDYLFETKVKRRVVS